MGKQKGVFEKELTRKELEKEKEFGDKINSIKKNLEKRAGRDAEKKVFWEIEFPFFVLAGIFIFFGFLILLKRKN